MKLFLTAFLIMIMSIGPLGAIIDVFSEITPSEKKQGYHSNLKLSRDKGGDYLLKLPHPNKDDGTFELLLFCDLTSMDAVGLIGFMTKKWLW